MSGTTFLEEIVTWDDEKCAEKVEEALPRLIICLENYKSYDEAVGILQIVCQSFVPVVQQEQLEDRVFCPLSHQVCQLMDCVVEEIQEAVREDQDIDTHHLIALLQHVVNIAQCVEECVKHMTTMADLHTCHVRSLVTCSFHLLKGSYSHCQESGSLYGDLLPALSDTLSLIFRTAHSLQMVLLNMLDRLVAPQSLSTQALQDMAQACADLFAVCRVVASLDQKLTISLWKALSKLAGPQADVLHSQVDVSGMVTYLCEEILSGITRLLQSAPLPGPGDEESLSQGDEKVFQKSVRILGFQMKVLVAMVRDFHGYLTDCVSGVLRVLLCLNSILPPNLSAPRLQPKHEEEVRQQLCNGVQPLLSHLVTSASFIHCVLNTQDKEPKKELASLLLLIAAMDSVAQCSGDVVCTWLNASSPSSLSEDQSDPSLVSVVFSALHTCHTEVCLPVYLPGPPCEGKPNRSVSVYQYVVEHVSAFIASCPAKLFHIIEKNLLQVLLGSNPISSQAAADCWCFLARFGTAELCWQQTQRILSLVLHVRETAPHCLSYRSLTSLLARLIKFLTPQHQTELAGGLTAAPFLWLWGEVGVSVLTTTVAQDVCQALLPVCLTALHSASLSPGPSLLQAATTLIPALQCLHTMLQGDTGAQRLTPQQGATLLDLIGSLWDVALPASSAFVTNSYNSEGHVRKAYLSALLSLTSDLVEQLDVKLILQILVLALKVMKDSTSGELTLAVLQLMQSLGRLKFPPSVEQGQILWKISDTFAAALLHPSASVQFAALDAFTQFAEQTPYEAVVPECLTQHDGLQEKVAAYLQKIPPPGEEPFDAVGYLQHQQRQFNATLQSPTQRPDPPDSVVSEPPPKRQKMDAASNPEQLHTFYQNIVEELETITEKMEKLQTDGPAPEWIQTRGKSLLQRLSACLDRR